MLQKLASAQLDINDPDWRITTFCGAWSREMRRVDTRLVQGTHVSESFTGTSSAIANPFFMLSRMNTDEDRGDVYGFNLIYSGNHMETAEVSELGKTRVQWGINPRGFTFVISPEESFTAPEAVMTYSPDGFNGMSSNMHRFVKRHIVRGTWRDKERPILLNSWEAAYFNISESKLLKLAKAAKSVGIELFVMDDGWFGERNDDRSSLGDWVPNKKKLPGGIRGISEKVEALGMKFGIWVEPEMVSVNSELYRKHPEAETREFWIYPKSQYRTIS
jgi:alpha-galactosidase